MNRTAHTRDPHPLGGDTQRVFGVAPNIGNQFVTIEIGVGLAQSCVDAQLSLRRRSIRGDEGFADAGRDVLQYADNLQCVECFAVLQPSRSAFDRRDRHDFANLRPALQKRLQAFRGFQLFDSEPVLLRVALVGVARERIVLQVGRLVERLELQHDIDWNGR